MKRESFTLPPASSNKSQVYIIGIPSNIRIINSAKPRLASTGDVKIVIAAVHDGEPYLSVRTMLERAVSESPLDNLQDLEEVLTRGLSVGCDYLVTGIRLRDSDGREYVLYLSRHDGRWVVRFDWVGDDFSDYSQVLCLGK